MSASVALAPALSSRRSLRTNKPTVAARAAGKSRATLQVVSGDYGGYTKEEWEAKLASTPSIGAAMTESNGVVAQQRSKFQAEANRSKYEKRAALTFGAVNQGKNPALAVATMDINIAAAAVERQLKLSLKNKVNPALEGGAFDATSAVARQVKVSAQAAWDAKLAAIPSLGAWSDTSKPSKDPQAMATEKREIYQRKANMVFKEVNRLAAAKATADANSALYQQKAQAVFAKVNGGGAAAAGEVTTDSAKSGNFLSGLVDGAIGLVAKVTGSFDEGDKEGSNFQKEVDARVAERSAWISKWRNDTQAKARTATWKSIDEGAGANKDLNKVIVVDLAPEDSIDGKNVKTLSDGSVLYSFAEL